MESNKRTPQFILLGDSLIQNTGYLSNGGNQFGAGLTEKCIRRFDVVNRGYSGYNSSQILRILETLIPPPSCAKLDFLLILLGSNDSCLPTSPTGQHVPLEQYAKNMKTIISHPSITVHNPTILLVTPPPVNDVHLQAEDFKKGYSALTRPQSVVAGYASAIRKLAQETKNQKVLLVDLWSAMMKEGARLTPGFVEGGDLLGSLENGDSAGLRTLLNDGLHMTGDGYKIFLKEVLSLIGPRMTDGHPDAQPWAFPHWSTAPRAE